MLEQLCSFYPQLTPRTLDFTTCARFEEDSKLVEDVTRFFSASIKIFSTQVDFISNIFCPLSLSHQHNEI